MITDAPPAAARASAPPLTKDHLRRMGHSALLPTQPFTAGGELGFDPARYRGFVGDRQKTALLPMHEAILAHLCALDGGPSARR